MMSSETKPANLSQPPRLALLPRLYRLILTVTRKHGLFTLARLHHRIFKDGQIIKLPGGAWLYIPPDPHYFGFLSCIHEDHVRKVIEKHLSPGDTCFDVGANIGYFAAMMAKQVGETGRIFAFEPVPETYEILSVNAGIAGASSLKIVPIQAAVSASDGELAIQRNEHSTLNQVSALKDANGSAFDRVPAYSLVSALSRFGCTEAISLLKVDVEGHELAVLEGARSLFREGRIRRMIIEVTPGADALAIGRLFTECGARWSCWLNGEWRSLPLAELPTRTDVLVEFPKQLSSKA